MDIHGFKAFSSSPSPWQPPIPHQKKCVAPIIVLCIFTNTTTALNMHSNHLPPRHRHYPPLHPSAHHHHCHHQHSITTTAIITTATLHAMPWSSTSLGLRVTGRKHVLGYRGNLGQKRLVLYGKCVPNQCPPRVHMHIYADTYTYFLCSRAKPKPEAYDNTSPY